MKVAILVADGFEQVELLKPRKALDAAGADERGIARRKEGESLGRNRLGKKIDVDVPIIEARADDFEALLLPRGVIYPDTLRIIPAAIVFITAFVAAGTPVASICHGPWTLIEAGAARGRRMTSWPSLKTDLSNAGADWVDKEVVLDNRVVTSRKPDDIPAFNREMIGLFAEARQRSSRAA
jgi:protease I